MLRVNPLVERMQGFGTTIFAEMSALAVATGSVNLGQGFPDTDGPVELLDAAAAAIRTGCCRWSRRWSSAATMSASR